MAGDWSHATPGRPQRVTSYPTSRLLRPRSGGITVWFESPGARSLTSASPPEASSGAHRSLPLGSKSDTPPTARVGGVGGTSPHVERGRLAGHASNTSADTLGEAPEVRRNDASRPHRYIFRAGHGPMGHKWANPPHNPAVSCGLLRVPPLRPDLAMRTQDHAVSAV